MRMGASAEKLAITYLITGAFGGCSDNARYTLVPNATSDAHSQKTISAELDPESLEKKLRELSEQSAKTAARANEVSAQLSQLFNIKQKLCEIQTVLFGQCYAHTPLAGLQWKQSAVCRKKVNLLNTRKFYATLSGGRGRFQLILDNTIESNLITSGQESEINWYSTGSRPLREIKISDINVFKLKAVDFDFPHDEEQIFTFKIDDKTLFTQADFLENSRTRKSVLLNTLPLRHILSSEICRIDETEIDAATESAVASTIPPSSIQTPAELFVSPTAENLKEAEEWINQISLENNAKSESYLALASDIARLRHDLRGDLQLGCWANEPIRTIEFLFEGSHLALADWDRSASSSQLNSSGDPAKLEIDLGGGLLFVNNDENSGPILRENGRLLAEPQAELSIGDISSVTVTKRGVAYSSLQNCWSTWGGLGKACEWQNREKSRYLMNSLTIKINNEAIYSRENLNHIFEKNSLVWFEKDLTANHAYRDIMRRRDCPIH